MKNIGHLIRQLRTERKLSQDELAARLGVTKQTISNYERDFRQPDYDGLVAICDALNVPMAFFLTDRERDDELARIYATYPVTGADVPGVASRVVKKPEAPQKKKTALDEVIDKLTVIRDSIPADLRPDEQQFLRDYRMLNSAQRTQLRLYMDALLDAR